jgi:hypothetical protein
MQEDSGSSDDERVRARERETRRRARNVRVLPPASPAPSQTEDGDEEARRQEAHMLQSLLTPRETEQHAKQREREVMPCEAPDLSVYVCSLPTPVSLMTAFKHAGGGTGEACEPAG